MFPILAIPVIAYGIYKLLKKDESYDIQANLIPMEFVDGILKNVIGSNCYVKLTDTIYNTPTLENMQKFMSEYTKAMNYINDKWDCDNIAVDAYNFCERRMPGCAMGFLQCTVPNGEHMVNFFIDPEGKLRIMDFGGKLIYDVPKGLNISFVYI